MLMGKYLEIRSERFRALPWDTCYSIGPLWGYYKVVNRATFMFLGYHELENTGGSGIKN